MEAERIISAGIDIGTSTTKIVISQFALQNMSGVAQVPRIEIIDKKKLYESPIFRTPLLTSDEIDIKAVEGIILSEYKKAGITPDEIKTGAVIITGESATKNNAEGMIHQLSDYAGEFLVATAGPDLEGIIAAKGSGAYDYSLQTNETIANIDIGGGTANIAVYKRGKLLGTNTLHIGGKLVETKNKTIQYIAPSIQETLNDLGSSLSFGDNYQPSELKKLTDYMTEVIVRILRGTPTVQDKRLLIGHEPEWGEPIDVIMFSGGVSECIANTRKGIDSDNETYEDIGMLLAKSLLESKELSEWKWLQPNETVRATVLGAGTQTTEISGVTIQVSPSTLPLKNLPVYKIPFGTNLERAINHIPEAVDEAVQLFDPLKEGQNFALYLTDLPLLGFRAIQKVAMAIVEASQKKPDPKQPLVIILERDLAKALGQTIETEYKNQDAVCVDQIRAEHGDYIDIGHVLKTGVVPVVVKTLAFSR